MSLLLPATSESNSLVQLSLKEIFGGGRGDTISFSYRISPDSITTTFGCVVKDDCITSCLIELQSFPLSKFVGHGGVVWAQEIVVAARDLDRGVLQIHVAEEFGELGLITCV